MSPAIDDAASRRERLALLGILLAFALVAAVHAWRLPAFEGPDEPGNLQYAQFIAIEGRLAQPSLVVTHELEVLDRGIVPPLWFLGTAVLVRMLGADEWRATPVTNPAFLRRAAPTAGGEDPMARLHHLHGRDEKPNVASPALRHLLLLRLTAIPAACLAIVAVWRAARAVAPVVSDDPSRDARFALGAAALLAATPQFQHLAGTVTMDLWVAAFGSLGIAACVGWVTASDTGRARVAAGGAGVWTGLAALTKLNGLVGVGALALAWGLARIRGGWRVALVAALACAVVGSGWYLWGWWETGHPLWMWHYQKISPRHNPSWGESGGEGLGRWALAFLLQLSLTWIGNFGWTAAWFPLPVTIATTIVFVAASAVACAAVWARWPRAAGAAVIAAVFAMAFVAWQWIGPWYEVFTGGRSALAYAALAAAVAIVCAALRFRRREPADEARAVVGRRALVFLLACAALILAAEVAFNLRFAQPQARHLYPFLPALVVPLAVGLSRLRLLLPALAFHAALSVWGVALVEHHLRPRGFDDSPLFHSTDALRLGRGDPTPSPPIWIAPEHGAVLTEAPTLVFEDPLGGMHDVVLAIRNPDLSRAPWREGPLFLRTSRDRGDPLVGTTIALPIPPALWASLAEGERLDAVVLALDEDGREARRSSVLTVRKGR